MKILIADTLDIGAVTQLAQAGHDCAVNPELTADTLPDHIAGFDVLIVRSTKVPAAVVEAADQLSLIVRAGAGTNTIDTAAAAHAGIYVCNVPGRNAIAVAELTLGLLLAVDRQIASQNAELKAGTWDKKRYSKADGLFGKRMAIIGLGDIGLAVAERAAAFGITVTALDKSGRSPRQLERIEAAGIELVPDERMLLAAADIVSVHVPANDDTAGMINREFLQQLPERAIVLNTSRGDVVDEAAMLAAIETRNMRMGTDVYIDEPGSGSGTFASALAQHPMVVGSHHIGASTEQAQQAIADGTVEVVLAFGRGDVENCVNLADARDATATVTVRHLDRVGVLAALLAVLRAAGLNVSDMTNTPFAGGNAAIATIDISGDLPAELIDNLTAIDNVLHVRVTE